jgi:predicted N-formylglutamate amidohydrolase
VIAGGFTRLVIDPNRPLDHPEAILRTVDGHSLPFNSNMDRGDLAARRGRHRAFHKAVDAALAEAGPAVYLIDQHSFDRHGPSPVAREVDIGVCAPGDTAFALRLLEELRNRTTPRAPGVAPDVRRRRLNVCLDQPYSAAHPGAFVIGAHVAAARAGVVIEVCDDLLGTEAETGAMADLLAECIAAAAEAHSADACRPGSE